jgi:hypothetical protein
MKMRRATCGIPWRPLLIWIAPSTVKNKRKGRKGERRKERKR